MKGRHKGKQFFSDHQDFLERLNAVSTEVEFKFQIVVRENTKHNNSTKKIHVCLKATNCEIPKWLIIRGKNNMVQQGKAEHADDQGK